MERKMCKQKIKVNSIVTVSVALDQLLYLDLGIGEKGKDMQVCLKNVHNLHLHLTAAFLVSSVGRVPVCQPGGCGFRPWLD